MDKEKIKKEEEKEKEIQSTKVEENNQEDVPEYVGPKFYGTKHPRQEKEEEAHLNHGTLQELVEKNIKWSQVIYNQNKKIKRRLTMIVIGNYLRLFIIIVPILIGFLYWPEILAKFNQYFGQYFSASGLDFSSIFHNASSTQGVDAAQLQNFLKSTK
ncbi:MAG: hypothetical protein A2493_01790 [Candidatus Magasanikbacteria bacterium RIFOXYC12_FULL_33_11]|uniref:Uncharacterized protein n=1 Tax=Candidatus Magasanikbacteria bacterium RIFOXYC12_FULL_33_11 TaxID=1798701 RepID=A0A1F6NSA4_9BACT|nr:MAG: hypothetical protein A2493_01790 [Candidatus Magasanikbacteria bacterium RIFOXYC12_FULL_33_11]